MARRPVITIGDRVKTARLKLKKSQYELAVEAGMRPECLSRIETGKSPGSLATLHKLCPVLGLTIDELTGKTDSLAAPTTATKKGKK
mgnify:CR=1 FL=1